jgi:hypothetical protein
MIIMENTLNTKIVLGYSKHISVNILSEQLLPEVLHVSIFVSMKSTELSFRVVKY